MSWATWPANPKERSAHDRKLSTATPGILAQVRALYDEDLADGGYVWNVSRLWAHQPDTLEQLFGLMSKAFNASGSTFRQRRDPGDRRRLGPR